MTDIDARLTQCFATVFPDLEASAIPTASPATTASWDSMASITLMTLVQEEFGVELDLEHFEEFDSFTKLKGWLEAHG